MSKRPLLLIILALILSPWLSLNVISTVHAQQTPTTPTQSDTPPTPLPAGAEPAIDPVLTQRPPGLEFEAVQRSGGHLRNSQLGQYIATMYRYAVGIVAILAIIMTVYGGFRYLIGSSMGDVAAGKKIIQDAIAGMLITLGAYLILQTVNPAILGFAPVTLKIVAPEAADEEQNSTHTGTGGDPSEGGPPSGTASGACPVTNLPPGHFDPPVPCNPPTAPNCRDHAVRPAQDPRSIAFGQRIGQSVRATDPRQRIIEVADAAIKCNLHLGSCGSTAGAIWRFSGVHPFGGAHIYESSAIVRQLMNMTCVNDCNNPAPGPAGCTNDKNEARTRARELVRAQQDARADMLQPGDWFWGYNANNSCSGQHSMIFVRWEGQRAVVRQGQWGRTLWESRVCLKTGCGNFMPITRIMRSAEVRALVPATPPRR